VSVEPVPSTFTVDFITLTMEVACLVAERHILILIYLLTAIELTPGGSSTVHTPILLRQGAKINNCQSMGACERTAKMEDIFFPYPYTSMTFPISNNTDQQRIDTLLPYVVYI
jgi:hypothetical protein